MLSGRKTYAFGLRQELIARNNSYAAINRLPHATSCSELPMLVYQRSDCGRYHGNFVPASYRAILRRPQWRRRLDKVHSHGRRSLPQRDGRWHELDSALSSDALLMNIFCYPGVTRRAEICGILGLESGRLPEFGFRPRVPLLSQAVERTEVDMKLGSTLFEAKLTEGDFQVQRAELVEGYRDFRKVFEVRELPKTGRKFESYQLIRNVLAARALDLGFCVLVDARRPDLIERWFSILRCVRQADLRARCKVLTWQELAPCLPGVLQDFLSAKYGIAGLK